MLDDLDHKQVSGSTTTAGTSTRALRSGTSEGSDEEKAARKKLRYDTLHEIEHGGNETAEVAELISTAVLRRHLETMLRLGIEYDFLPRESEILHLNFWEAAFEQLKKTGVLYFETEGKNKGCWVMRRPGAADCRRRNGRRRQGHRALQRHRDLCRQGHCLSPLEVRPAGPRLRLQAVLPLLRPRVLDFDRARRRASIRTSAARRPSTTSSIRGRSDPQANVVQALRGMGYTEQADRYTHFGYEMVALTPALRGSSSATSCTGRSLTARTS